MKTKKTILTAVIAILSLTIMVNACDDINYTVRYLQKGESGCYPMIVFSIEKSNCNQTCFSEFSSAKYSTNTGQIWNFKISSPSQMTNPFTTYIRTLNCSNGVPYDFYANLVGETKNCTFSFRFEEEYQTYLTKLTEQEKRIAEEQKLLEAAEQQRLLLEQQRLKALEKLNQPNPVETLPKINSTLNSTMDNVTIIAENEIIEKTSEENEVQTLADTQKPEDNSVELIRSYKGLILILFLIILIVVVGSIIFVILRKPKHHMHHHHKK